MNGGNAERGGAPSEKGEGDGKSYLASVRTPTEVIEELQKILPQASKVDALVMYAHTRKNDPLPKLGDGIIDVAQREGIARIGLSRNHRRLSTGPTKKRIPLPLYFRQSEEDKRRIADNDRYFATFESKGVDIYDTSSQTRMRKYSVGGFLGNVHSKFIQVHLPDRVVTFVPEFNLTEQHINAENNALRFEETVEVAARKGSITRTVADYIEKVRSGEEFADYAVDINDELRLVVDSGRVGRSLIRREAREMLKSPSVQDIYFASQYPPFGTVLHALRRKAKEGATCYVLLSDDCREGKHAAFNNVFLKRIEGLDNIHVFYSPKTEVNRAGLVHSKWLMANTGIELDKDSGRVRVKEGSAAQGSALATSNNLFPVGYAFGTGEAGFLIRDQELFAQMRDVAVDQLNRAILAA